MGSWFGEVACLIAGALLTLSFAPFEIFPLAILAPAILLAAWLTASTARAFLRGLIFGMGFFGTGVSWVFISMHDFGNVPIWLSVIITMGFVLILALFPATNGYVFNRYFPKTSPAKIICVFPATWVLFEWIRSWIFTGFPWLFLGYSQMDSPLKGYAPFMSVYAVSLAVAVSSALLLSAILSFKREQAKNAYFYLFGLALIWALGGSLSFLSFTKSDGKPFQVSLVQGNVPQELKWVPEHLQPTLDLYQHLTEQHWDSKIIIWPEAAVPITLQDAQDYLAGITTQATKHDAAVITGIFIKSPQSHEYYNSVITLGKGSGLYIKQHLLPFGEFTPIKRYIGKLLDFFQIPMSDVSPGDGKLFPIIVNGIKISTFLCYEIAFPEEVLRHDGNIGIILTATNDAWFGHSIAQVQHLEMARMRSLELGRPGLFVGNSGLTAFITPTGKIQSAAQPFEQTVLTDIVQPTQGHTPWQRFGMDPILLILIILLFFGWKQCRPK